MVTKHFNDAGKDFKLFTPGPVEVPDWVLAEMGKANDTHRSLAYREMHHSIRENVQKLLHTKNEVLLWANSGSGVMEACVRNLIKDDETAVFFTCGAFGDRWVSIAKSNGKKADVVSVEWGKAITPELVKETLAKKKYPIVFIQLNETSTGVKNPLAEIGPIVHETGALLCVDAVSGMGGTPMRVDDWGIDVALASVQKCFAIPPGLALSAISEQAFEKAKTVENRGFYFDFLELKKKADIDEHPITPCIPQIRSLKKVLERINEIGGDKFAQDHEERCQMIRTWAIDNGFEILSKDGYHSQTVVTIENIPSSPLKGDKELTQKFVNGLFEKGYKIVNGYGSKLKGKTFRMAPMGWITKAEVQELLNAASEVLKEMN